jgi:hypothetical protein
MTSHIPHIMMLILQRCSGTSGTIFVGSPGSWKFPDWLKIDVGPRGWQKDLGGIKEGQLDTVPSLRGPLRGIPALHLSNGDISCGVPSKSVH